MTARKNRKGFAAPSRLIRGLGVGGHLVFPPADGSPTKRLNVAMRVLREKRVLYVMPDLTRKANEGVPATIWDRVVYFPTGVMRSYVAMSLHCSPHRPDRRQPQVAS